MDVDDFPEEFRYSESHEFVSLEGTTATIGLTDYAVEQLGDIVYIELPEIGEIYTSGDSFGVIESVKAVSDLYSPIGGEVIAVNDNVIEKPELLKDDAYERGWLIKIKMEDSSEFDDLMSAADYADFVSGLD